MFVWDLNLTISEIKWHMMARFNNVSVFFLNKNTSDLPFWVSGLSQASNFLDENSSLTNTRRSAGKIQLFWKPHPKS